MYACFLEVLTWLVHTNVPVNVVRLGPRNPPFITPLIKQLLRIYLSPRVGVAIKVSLPMLIQNNSGLLLKAQLTLDLVVVLQGTHF